jgi:thiamine biosynthesis lipoprotein
MVGLLMEGKRMSDQGHRRPTRREFIGLGIGALAVSAVPLLRRKDQVIRRTFPVMGTLAEITVVHPDRRYGHRAVDAAVRSLQSTHFTLTRYETTSEVGQVNDAAGERPMAVSAATASVVEESLRWARASNGRFDPALGRAVDLWDFTDADAPPPAGEWGRFARAGLYRMIEVGAENGAPAVFLQDPRLALDLGGIGKGYGVDRAVETLREWGMTSALVNVGGDLFALGTSPTGDAWTVGVRDPDDPTGILVTLDVSDAAVATSGDYQRYFEHHGQRYHHLLDPATGAPRETAARSVTILAGSCISADAGATVAFGMPAGEANALLRSADASALIVHSV